MKVVVTTLLLGMVSIAGAAAKDFSVPDDNPVASVSIPDTWKASEIEHGYEAKSPGDDVYFSIETAPNKDVKTLMDDNIEWFKSNGIVAETTNKSALTIDGASCTMIQYTGKDSDGPTAVDFIACPSTKGDSLIWLTVWGSLEEREKVKADLDGIESSVKIIK